MDTLKIFKEVVYGTCSPSCHLMLCKYLPANGTLIWDFVLICLMAMAFTE